MFPSPKLPNFCTKSPRPRPEDQGPACQRCPPLLTLRVGLLGAPIFPLGRVFRSTASRSPPRAPGAVISYSPGPAGSRASHLQPRPTQKRRDRLGGKHLLPCSRPWRPWVTTGGDTSRQMLAPGTSRFTERTPENKSGADLHHSRAGRARSRRSSEAKNIPILSCLNGQFKGNGKVGRKMPKGGGLSTGRGTWGGKPATL